MASVRKTATRLRPRKYPRNIGTSVRQSATPPSPDVKAQVMLDEPAFLGAGENPETDIASTVLSHPISERLSSMETDAAPSAIDDVLPGAIPADPSVCSEADAKPETAEDLH